MTRRVPRALVIRDNFTTSSGGTNSGGGGGSFGSIIPCMAARPRPPAVGGDTPGILHGGFEFLRHTTIIFGICNITNPTIAYELSLFDANGTVLATSGSLTKAVVDGRVSGTWLHGIAERNDVFSWFYCTSDANYDVQWSVAMSV